MTRRINGQKVSRREFLRFLGVTVGAGALAACGPAAAPTAAPATEAPKPEATKASAEATATSAPKAEAVEIIYWDNNAFDIYQKPWDEKYPSVVAKFVPEAKVTIAHAQDGDKFLTAVSAGTPPDLFFTWDQSGKLGSWIVAGVLAPLDDYMAGSNLSKDEYPSGMLDQALYAGKVYGLPMLADGGLLWYRPSVLKQAGVDKVPETTDEYWQVAEKLTKKDASGNITNMGADMPGGWNMLTWVVNYGGKIWDSETKQVTPDDPGIVAAWEDLAAQWDKYGPDQVDLWSASRGATFGAEDPFLKDKQFMEIDGEWMTDTIRSFQKDWKRGTDFECAPVPYPAGKPENKFASDLETYPVVIPYNAKNKDLGWKATLATQDLEFTIWWASLLVNLPQLNKALEDPRITVIPGLDINAKILVEGKHNFRPVFPAMPIGAEYQDAFNREFDLVIHQKKTAQQSLSDLKAELQPKLDKALKG